MPLIYSTSLSDRQWSLVAPLFSSCTAQPGRQPAPNRTCLDGILYVILNRVSWLDLPPGEYPPYTVCYKRYISWVKNGIWEFIYTILLADLHARTGIDLPREIQSIHLRKKAANAPSYRLPPAITSDPENLRVGLLFLCHLTALLEDDSRRLVTA